MEDLDTLKQNNLLILSHQKGLQILSPARFRISKKKLSYQCSMKQSCGSITFILVRIRIRGLVPVPLTPDPGISFSDLQDDNAKNIYFTFFFLITFYSNIYTLFQKDRKTRRSHKTEGIKVFLAISAWLEKDPDPYLVITDPDPGGPKIYTDPEQNKIEETLCLTTITINHSPVWCYCFRNVLQLLQFLQFFCTFNLGFLGRGSRGFSSGRGERQLNLHL